MTPLVSLTESRVICALWILKEDVGRDQRDARLDAAVQAIRGIILSLHLQISTGRKYKSLSITVLHVACLLHVLCCMSLLEFMQLVNLRSYSKLVI